ncbi:MAG: hypothetical protein ACLR5S_01230 [Ruminococcus sp.]
MIAEGLEVYQKNGCDCLIGISGSPLDAMKAIAVGTTSSAPLASIWEGDQRSASTHGSYSYYGWNRF